MNGCCVMLCFLSFFSFSPFLEIELNLWCLRHSENHLIYFLSSFFLPLRRSDFCCFQVWVVLIGKSNRKDRIFKRRVIIKYSQETRKKCSKNTSNRRRSEWKHFIRAFVCRRVSGATRRFAACVDPISGQSQPSIKINSIHAEPTRTDIFNSCARNFVSNFSMSLFVICRIGFGFAIRSAQTLASSAYPHFFTQHKYFPCVYLRSKLNK